MAILAFQKPESVIVTESSSTFGRFEFRPLEPGYGITIGNALRRILLSSLEGYAISTIRIDGVNHEFATIPGVLEDVTNIILNLKQVRFAPRTEGATEEAISLTIVGKEQFVAGDLSAKLTDFTVLNPELLICNIDADASITIDIVINKGRGYVPADEKTLPAPPKRDKGERADELPAELQVIPIDSIYTPIRNVKYFTENYRVEQKTDYERLILEVTTDGSISPEEALKESARILIEHFRLFSDTDMLLDLQPQREEGQGAEAATAVSEEALKMNDLLETSLKEFDLSVRAVNCFNTANITTLGQLVAMSKEDLQKLRNFGKKTEEEVVALVEEKLGLSFGMNVSKYTK